MTSLTPISRPRAWLESLRLRTLPLALASIITGSAIAAWQHTFSLGIALLALPPCLPASLPPSLFVSLS